MGSSTSITLVGVNFRPGDIAVWMVDDGVTDCNSRNQKTSTLPKAIQIANGATATASFTFLVPGPHVLCYQFTHEPYIPMERYPAVRVAAITVGSPMPFGTAVGCESTIEVTGAGFLLLGGSPALNFSCSWGGLGVTAATVVTDTTLACPTAAQAASSRGTIAIELTVGPDYDYGVSGSAWRFAVAGDFQIFEFSSTVTSVLPAGGPFNVELAASISGTGLLANYGNPGCSFHSYVGAEANAHSATLMSCNKPAFPNEARSITGPVAVHFSPNGQCIPPDSTRGTTFVIYNALVDSVIVSGAPATSSVTLRVIGEGFPNPGLPGAKCKFTGRTVAMFTPATTLDNQTIDCPTPAFGVPDTYTVSVFINGVVEAPSLFDPPLLSEYDLGLVRIASIIPPGGPIGESTTITLSGSGFADYGTDQLQCKVGSQLLGGTLLDATRVICIVPPYATAEVLQVMLSLNGGSDGTFSSDVLPWRVYATPRIDAIMPSEGEAYGGTNVTIVGSGFSALSTSYKEQLAYLRCRFGKEVQATPPSFHNDTVIHCTTTWGEEGQAGELVTVALNGETFTSLGSTRFVFVGLHKPALVEVTTYHFPVFSSSCHLLYHPPRTTYHLSQCFFPAEEATTLQIIFDSQPTNRAGMNGLSACSAVLSDATVLTLQGSSSEPALCDWSDDSTLVAYLTMFTDAAPGMSVHVRGGVLWPQAWAEHKGSCDVVDSMCADAHGLIVDPYFPCDRRDTEERELCSQPVALVQAADEISSCPGTALTLDGSRSSGGGIKPLTFRWFAHPTLSDNYLAVQPTLSRVNQSSATLRNELDGGLNFRFLLRVSTFLGRSTPPYSVTVQRARIPIPTITIEAEPFLLFRASTGVTLQAKATLASCFTGAQARVNTLQLHPPPHSTSMAIPVPILILTLTLTLTQVDFTWKNHMVDLLPEAPADTVALRGSHMPYILLCAFSALIYPYDVRGTGRAAAHARRTHQRTA